MTEEFAKWIMLSIMGFCGVGVIFYIIMGPDDHRNWRGPWNMRGGGGPWR